MDSADCGCPVSRTIIDPKRHAAWHAKIAPLKRGDGAELQEAYGFPSIPQRTYVDDQFDQARGKTRVHEPR